MTDKDDKVIDIQQAKFKQLSLDLDIPKLTQEQTDKTKESKATKEALSDASESTPEQTALSVPKESFNVMPNTLQVAAESSMSLRGVQAKLATLLTSDLYVSTIAAIAPEVLPNLMDSVTNAVATSDNLLIRMAQVSEKSASMQRAFDYLVRQKEQLSDAKASLEKKDEYYDETVEKIKRAIYKNLDDERDEHPRTAQDYVDESDIKENTDYIDAEYSEVPEDTIEQTDDFSDIPEE